MSPVTKKSGVKSASVRKTNATHSNSSFDRVDWLAILCIITAVVLSFLPALKNDFVDWDDTGMFVQNFNYRGLAWPNIKWMFTTTHYAHYHPITWLTLGLDYKIWGMNPMGYHLGNIIFQALNGVLAYWLIKKILQRTQFSSTLSKELLCWSSAIGALLFAIHPLRVESVAWATERRDVVSGFFYLLTLLAYLRADDDPQRRRKWLAAALGLFVLSFLSKAWGITLPVVLLVLDVYPSRRIKLDALRQTLSGAILEKIPFFAVSAVLAVVAFRGQQQWGIKALDFSLAKRVMNAAYGLVFYPWKTLVPINLSPIYPLDPNFNPGETKYLLCLLAGLLITTALFALRRRFPAALAAWITYGVIISPVLGITQSGEQIAADRYSYLSCLPFAVLAAAGVVWILQRIQASGTKMAVCVSSAALVVVLAILTFNQTKTWHDDLSLWNQALKADRENFVAYNGRGKLYLDHSKWDLALADFNEAIRLNPRRVAPWTNRGYVYYYMGNQDAALADFNKSLEVQPQHETYNNRGALREVKGDIDGAIADYTASINLVPNTMAFENRGRLLQRRGDAKGAFDDFSKAISINPEDVVALQRRGEIRMEKENYCGAADDFEHALKAAPANWPNRSTVEQELQSARRFCGPSHPIRY